jgi:hypothetical protein
LPSERFSELGQPHMTDKFRERDITNRFTNKAS